MNPMNKVPSDTQIMDADISTCIKQQRVLVIRQFQAGKASLGIFDMVKYVLWCLPALFVLSAITIAPVSPKIVRGSRSNRTTSLPNVYLYKNVGTTEEHQSERTEKLGDSNKQVSDGNPDLTTRNYHYVLPASYAYVLSADGKSKSGKNKMIEPMLKSAWLSSDNSVKESSVFTKRQEATTEDGSESEYVTPDQMMSFISSVLQTRQDKPDTSLLSKLTEDPVFVLVALSLPIAILLAAVLPVLLSNYLESDNTATVITTSAGRSYDLSNVERFAPPVLRAVAMGLNNPLCIERIICDTVKEEIGNPKENSFLNRTIGFASSFIRANWLESMGMTDIVRNFINGDCKKIVCLSQIEKDVNEKTR